MRPTSCCFVWLWWLTGAWPASTRRCLLIASSTGRSRGNRSLATVHESRDMLGVGGAHHCGKPVSYGVAKPGRQRVRRATPDTISCAEGEQTTRPIESAAHLHLEIDRDC